jgi:hypothetical protein
MPFERGKASPALLTMERSVIIAFDHYYLHGFRAGGPVRMIVNMVEHLGDEFEFRVVTSDRNVRDCSPYPVALAEPVALQVATLAREERRQRDAEPKRYGRLVAQGHVERSPIVWMIALCEGRMPSRWRTGGCSTTRGS